MTRNQIDYWDLQERKRSNKEQEAVKWDERKEKNALLPYTQTELATRSVEHTASALEKGTKSVKNVADIFSPFN